MINIAGIALTLLVLCILTAIAIIDAKTMTIPNALNLALLVCGILAIFIVSETTLLSRFIGALCISVPLLLITILVPDAFGGGDVKLMAAAGFLLGLQSILAAACIGIFIGGVYGIYLLASKRKTAKEHFAFGPALCVGIALVLLFETDIASGVLPCALMAPESYVI
jgi:leader peptidase (prepilin peptidase)/N-methyltransferase